ncbi:MAG: hypothetical protein ABH885_05125 [Candidatus Omnitrophota bacterium]
MKLGRVIANNFILKLFSLLLAVTTWFYVMNEAEQRGSTAPQSKISILPSYGRLISRRLYVKAIFIGQLPDGYRLLADEVKIDPPYFLVAGPDQVFREVTRLETEPIDLSRLRRSTTEYVNIAPIAPSIDTESLTVKVIVPIKKIETDTDKEG